MTDLGERVGVEVEKSEYGVYFFFFSSRRRHTRSKRDWSSDVCSSDLKENELIMTYRVIAEKTNTSLQTVSETMKALQESNLLSKIRNGYYRVNPDVIFKGGRNDRMNVLLRYSKGE